MHGEGRVSVDMHGTGQNDWVLIIDFTLRGITKRSNDLLLQVVEDLSYVFSDLRENGWDPNEVQKAREGFLAELLKARDGFVYRHEAILLAALERDGMPIVTQQAECVALSA